MEYIELLASIITFLTPLIAFLALIRPELSALRRYFFSSIDFYPSGRLEIGFSDYGPTIGINGTLRAINSEQFIVRSEIKLVRLRDQATYQFDWAVFRNFDFLQAQNSKIDIASAFSLQNNESKQINIQFHDTKTLESYRNQLIDFSNKFKTFVNKQKTEDQNDFDEEKEEFQVEEKRKEFKALENRAQIELYATMGRSFYWQPGEYEFEISFMTDRRRKNFCKKYRFLLSQEQMADIDLNRIFLIDACLSKAVDFNFAHVTFYEIKR